MDFPFFEDFQDEEFLEERVIWKYELVNTDLNEIIMTDILRWLFLTSNFDESSLRENYLSFIISWSIIIFQELILFGHSIPNLILISDIV